MFVFRQEQMNAFEQRFEQDFVDSIVEDLRRDNPESVSDFDDFELQRRIRIGIERALQYGLEDDYSVDLFVTLMFIVAPNFDCHQLFQDVLREESLSPEYRMDYALDFAMDKDWEEIEADYDDSIWI